MIKLVYFECVCVFAPVEVPVYRFELLSMYQACLDTLLAAPICDNVLLEGSWITSGD